MKYRAEIDGLRALAVLPVIFFHAGFEFFGGGFVGVDIFFVISGYLITAILIDEIDSGKFSIVNFYERRARRILPALSFVVLICIPFAFYLMTPSQLKEFSASLIAVSLFASNILFWKESGYFEASSEEKPLLHTWSLAVEEQYYTFFPIFLLLVWKYGRHRVFWLIAGLSLLSLMLSEWGWRNNASANFYLAPSRAWELLSGSLAAFIVHKHGVRTNNPLSLFGLVLIMFAIFAYDKTIPFPSVYTLVPVGGTVLIVLFAGKGTIAAKVLSVKACVGIGLISYSAYLWHQPLFAFAKLSSINAPNGAAMLFLAGLSLVLAYFSWKYVEHPFRNKSHFPREAIFRYSSVSLVALIALGISGYVNNGFYDTIFNDSQRKLIATANSSPKRKSCHSYAHDSIAYEHACVYESETANVAVFGDSNAVEFAYSLVNELDGGASGVKHLSHSRCKPYFETTPAEEVICAQWTMEAMKGLANDPMIETVIVTYRLNAYLFGGHEGKYPLQPQRYNNTTRQSLWKNFIAQLTFLVNSNKQVVLVYQAPELPKSIETLVLKSYSEDGEIAGVSRKWWDERNRFVSARAIDIPEAVITIDPSSLFCDETNCFATKNGDALYFDGNHMSVKGATLVAKEIVKNL